MRWLLRWVYRTSFWSNRNIELDLKFDSKNGSIWKDPSFEFWQKQLLFLNFSSWTIEPKYRNIFGTLCKLVREISYFVFAVPLMSSWINTKMELVFLKIRIEGSSHTTPFSKSKFISNSIFLFDFSNKIWRKVSKIESYKLMLKNTWRYSFLKYFSTLYQLEASVILKCSAKSWWIRPKSNSNSRETSGPANWTLKRYPRSRDQFPSLDCSDWPWTRLNSSLQSRAISDSKTT